MPTADEILKGLSEIANTWTTLAILWHAYFAVFAAAVSLGWRPSKRLVGVFLFPPIVSVSALAWISGNPFSGTIFAMLAFVLIWLIGNLEPEPVAITSFVWIAAAVYCLRSPGFIRISSKQNPPTPISMRRPPLCQLGIINHGLALKKKHHLLAWDGGPAVNDRK